MKLQLRPSRLPAMWQQFVDLAVFLRRQASQHVLQIGVWIMPVELGTLNQTHHRSRTLPRPQGTCEQPIVATNGNRANLVFDPVVIDWQLCFGLCSRCQVFELLLDSGNIGINRLVEQADLCGIEQFAAAPELPAFERGQFVGEFVDLGLAVQDVAVFGCDGPTEGAQVRLENTSMSGGLLRWSVDRNNTPFGPGRWIYGSAVITYVPQDRSSRDDGRSCNPTTLSKL